MNWIRIAIIGCLSLETTHVIALDFFPDKKWGNSTGVFKAWEKSKFDPEIHNFVKYLFNRVTGTKLIFIMLLIVILLTADEQTLLFSGFALTLSIASFFWRLFPLIQRIIPLN